MATTEVTQRRKLVLVTEEREILRSTVPGLLESFAAAFGRGEQKVERLVYERGRPTFTVERFAPSDSVAHGEDGVPNDPEFATAYQMVRQHADLEVQEFDGDALESLARAVQSLVSRGFRLTMFICRDRQHVRDWVRRELRIEDVWQVPLTEDEDVRRAEFFVVGSKSGPLIRDIEAAILCRMGGRL